MTCPSPEHSAPNLTQAPEHPTSTSGRRGRRPLGLLVAACLVVAGAAVGTTVALAGRDPGPAATGGAGQVAAAQPAAQPADGGQVKANGTSRDTSNDSKGNDSTRDSSDTAAGAAVPPDGVHHTLIRKVDIASLTVRDGVVHAIKERQIHPAC